MNWFKNLFKKDKKVIKEIDIKIEDSLQVNSETTPLELVGNYSSKIEECFDCKQNIETYQKIRHWGGKAYHKNCLRKLIKKARQSI